MVFKWKRILTLMVTKVKALVTTEVEHSVISTLLFKKQYI